jgi:hypothetical protein
MPPDAEKRMLMEKETYESLEKRIKVLEETVARLDAELAKFRPTAPISIPEDSPLAHLPNT